MTFLEIVVLIALLPFLVSGAVTGIVLLVGVFVVLPCFLLVELYEGLVPYAWRRRLSANARPALRGPRLRR